MTVHWLLAKVSSTPVKLVDPAATHHCSTGHDTDFMYRLVRSPAGAGASAACQVPPLSVSRSPRLAPPVSWKLPVAAQKLTVGQDASLMLTSRPAGMPAGSGATAA